MTEIKVRDALNSRFPATRDSACKLIAGVSSGARVILDFADVDVASRSFVDEILTLAERLKAHLELRNASTAVAGVFEGVRQSRRRRDAVFQAPKRA
jgi:hypothetical protein